MTEEWRAIPEHEFYEVSDQGRVRSLPYKVATRGATLRNKPGKVLKLWADKDGYPSVTLCVNYVKTNYRVHQLVAAAFIGPCPEGMEAAHVDGGRTDNRRGNLVYVTHGENMDHKLAHGTTAKGSKNPKAKLTEQDVVDLKDLYGLGVRNPQLAREFGVTYRTVRRIISGDTWTYLH